MIFVLHRQGALVRPRYICPADFVRLGNGCYFFSSHISSWQNAHFACRDMGAQLASLDSRWEDTTIRTYLSKPEFGTFQAAPGIKTAWVDFRTGHGGPFTPSGSSDAFVSNST